MRRRESVDIPTAPPDEPVPLEPAPESSEWTDLDDLAAPEDEPLPPAHQADEEG